MKYKSFLLGSCAILLLMSVVSIGTSAGINDTQAVISVSQFLEKGNIIVQDINEYQINADSYYVIVTEDGEFWVNSKNSKVELAIFIQNMNNNADITISMDEAYNISEDYLAQYYTELPVEDLELTETHLEQHGDAGSEYTFVWREVIDDVTTPNYAIVGLNPHTGDIVGYVGIYRAITIPVDSHPAITRNDAIDIAKKAIDGVSISSINPELKILIDQNGDQNEIWEICIDGRTEKPSMSFVSVKTGETFPVYKPVRYFVKVDVDTGQTLDVLRVW